MMFKKIKKNFNKINFDDEDQGGGNEMANYSNQGIVLEERNIDDFENYDENLVFLC